MSRSPAALSAVESEPIDSLPVLVCGFEPFVRADIRAAFDSAAGVRVADEVCTPVRLAAEVLRLRSAAVVLCFLSAELTSMLFTSVASGLPVVTAEAPVDLSELSDRERGVLEPTGVTIAAVPRAIVPTMAPDRLSSRHSSKLIGCSTMSKSSSAPSVSGLSGVMPVRVEYSIDLLDGSTIDRLGGHFRRLVQQATDDPDRPVALIGLRLPEEQRRLLRTPADTAVPVPTATLGTLQATVVAVEDPRDTCLTYAELDARAAALAAELTARGAGRPAPRRCLGCPARCLGWPHGPRPDHHRCGVSGQRRLRRLHLRLHRTHHRMLVLHRAIVNRLLCARSELGLTATDRVLPKTPATFDVSVWSFSFPGATDRDGEYIAGRDRSSGWSPPCGPTCRTSSGERAQRLLRAGWALPLAAHAVPLLGVRLAVTALFRHPSPARLAAHLAERTNPVVLAELAISAEAVLGFSDGGGAGAVGNLTPDREGPMWTDGGDIVNICPNRGNASSVVRRDIAVLDRIRVIFVPFPWWCREC